jgi:hypothetical protein
MKIWEILNEAGPGDAAMSGMPPVSGPMSMDAGVSPIEDEAEQRGDYALITTLEWLRHEAEESEAVTPRIAVDTVIERVQNIPGNEAFNFAALDAAFKTNPAVKSLIKSIKDDSKNGTKYIYLTRSEDQIDEPESESGDSDEDGEKSKEDSSNIVKDMAKRASKK